MRIHGAHAALLVLGISSTISARQAKREYASHTYYVLEHEPGSSVSPVEAAAALGAELVEQVGELRDHWLIRRAKEHAQRDTVMDNYRSLRQKASSPISARSLEARRIVSATRSISPQVPRQRVKRKWIEPELQQLVPRQSPESNENHTRFNQVKDKLHIDDPEFIKQWHLLNEEAPPHDMNVTGVWELGYTGKGIISAIVDDGLDFNSDDLGPNYWAAGSYDYNDHVPEPLPRLSDDQHGTRCAGEVAAVRNDVCGVGVAYDSKVAGVRILSGNISDADEAAALNYGYNETSIYSCSWGPPDDGRSMEAPSSLIKKAVLNGIENGRGGKGSIFVFASGNGAGSDDQCNFDGYTNSIYSVTVAAVDWQGKHPFYSEACAANMIVAYTSGGGKNVHTTDIGKRKCTGGHGGTSAAAPLAVGVFALTLEARPELTWRDIQHLCVNTAREVSPEDPDWEKTSQGRRYSYKYGFGALDAYRFVTAAKAWTLVKPQAWIEMPQLEFGNPNITWEGEMSGGDFIPPQGIESSMAVTQQLLEENNFEKLEHVTVQVWINHSRRGDVEVALTSPNGIKSVLGGRRRYDEDKSGYPGWTFMTVKHWDENPLGNWTIKVNDQATAENNGTFLGWSMTFWGSTIDPSKAKLFSKRPPKGTDIPPSDATTTIEPVASTSTQRTKPTDHLPDDHDKVEGENNKPAFPGSKGANGTSPSQNPTPDEGYFSHMSDLLSSQTWLFAGLGLITLLAVGAGFFIWRRRASRRQRGGEYTSLAADDVAMGTMDPESQRGLLSGRGGSGRTKELYDAFGEPSDDEEEYEEGDDENMRGAGSRISPITGLRYHDGFLDDESAANSPAVPYRDEPTQPERRGVPEDESVSGSGTGSWEDAHTSDDDESPRR